MRIYAMTATFGKLEHETLSFQPGLNVIEAPNEWGKSTWCAFLITMLYGLDTRAKSTKTALADKEHYAPWSGSPMSGRIDLCWKGRDITIERATKGRIPLGQFRAYETATGLDIPEISADNCGQVLLGVERSVFCRAGFLRLTDLPVTQDDALRRRLNSLVTTGDESSAGDTLRQSLKDLKNKCRFNRTGLLPQAEAQREQLQGQIDELEHLNRDLVRLTQQQQELEQRLAQLTNHKAALRYASAMEDAEKVRQAEQSLSRARQVLAEAQALCDGLPSPEEAREMIRKGQALQQSLSDLTQQQQALPQMPQEPNLPQRYAGTDPVAQAEADAAAALALESGRRRQTPLFWILAAGLVIAGIVMLPFRAVYGWAGIILAAVMLIAGIVYGLSVSRHNKALARREAALRDKYPGISRENWVEDAARYAGEKAAYETQCDSLRQQRADLAVRLEELQSRIRLYSPDQSLPQTVAHWQQTLAAWDARAEAARDAAQAENHAQTVRSMANTADPAPLPDLLTYPEDQTDTLIGSARNALQQLHGLIGQNQGRALVLGDEAGLRAQLQAVNSRIRQLEDMYAALEIAQDALFRATTQLQRRFAPRISKRAQELFSRITGGCYDRIAISEDLSLSVGSGNEDVLRQALWRSDGTVDALYLSLRLAVAEELTPNAPLVLDDALARLDDRRLAAVMDILKDMAEKKQVILFSCQGREKEKA